jgi:3-oxoacyl-[acyl-carrier protein] reductase
MTGSLQQHFDWKVVGDALSDSVTLIVGGARGTGKTIAENLLRLGARVSVSDVSPQRIEAVESEFADYGDRFTAMTGDATLSDDARRVAAHAAEAFGALNNVVYSAGAYRAQRPTLEIDSQEWDLIVDSNLKGAFVSYQASIPHIVASGGGSLVSISSLAGRTSSPFLGCHYSAAKAGILGLTRHLAKEFGAQNIRANSICPGGIVGTRMTDLLTELGRESDLVELAKQTPLGRNVYEHDVAGVTLFLLSDLSRFVTGATIDVNGGILTI